MNALRKIAVGCIAGLDDQVAMYETPEKHLCISVGNKEIEFSKDTVEQLLPFISYWVESGSLVNRADISWRTIQTS